MSSSRCWASSRATTGPYLQLNHPIALSPRSAVSPSSHCAKSVPTTTAHLQRGPCSRSSVYPRSPAWLISPSAFSRCVSMRPSPLPRRRPAPSVSAFCPRGFVRRSGMIHSPAPVGRALSHPPLIILLQYLRAPPRRVSGERPHAFVVMEKMGWSWLVYEVRRRLLGNAKEDFTLDPCCRTTGWTENDENCNANTMRRDKRLLFASSWMS